MSYAGMVGARCARPAPCVMMRFAARMEYTLTAQNQSHKPLQIGKKELHGMNVVILGCGRVGSTLARLMYKDGHSVTIIDLQSEAFRRLGTKYKGQRIVGNGIDED